MYTECDFENPEWEYETAFCYGEDIIVFRRCPRCGRFIKRGDAVIERPTGDIWGGVKVEFPGWECSHCGPIEPLWTRGVFA